ncbi:chemotaxis-specific protein-glutamate methyltransferase CheB [Paramagnetospirillum magneticum]|uniref:Protein-glutamate methylesterase/protein-glutamine glutaminase 3 n=1 Tax=Paramagnetospirillum magneticum (strain ATCC 700264 / AMB-1) TaxID=342108 RepID=CHEB3_PARM1|nr:chemotaxis-specific protein-glutamate methyltransferase CheB [Paramagnetospirillum magneticum]Q2W2W9.1 RecName: Full=Protein-glutamate methylesterase/protein-glutamine glutaminase 3 [Paramagnetospirillum magneticum AMB-1]BAE51806.1 Chemotaxis response regulator containing a CheY-like receiver domain and a methylesterase domain [Paramagnetospirillum magneticum AMB-1]
MPARGKISVLIVDDSGMARAMLRSIFEDEDDFDVVAEAVNGREAIEMVRHLRPGLVTMDLEMPEMGGLEAIEEIMCSKAVPILVVSGVADAQKAFGAMSRGAVDVVAKPNVTSAREVEDFVDKARLVAKIPVITVPRTRSAPAAGPTPVPQAPPPPAAPPAGDGGIIAIAASTGGPQALAALLAAIGRPLSCPMVVAQHISDGFASGMADWLNSISAMPVRLAAEGERLTAGTVYLSPSEWNMSVTESRHIALALRPERQVYRPSCDALLTSVAQVAGRRAVGVILTGMGSDGVAGMEAISKAGGTTLGQDEGSSVIFGMNAIAIERGWVQRVLPLAELAASLLEITGASVGAAP